MSERGISCMRTTMRPRRGKRPIPQLPVQAERINVTSHDARIRSIAVRYPRREPSGKKPRGARQPLRLGGTETDWKQGDFYGGCFPPAAINPLSRLFIAQLEKERERERETERIPHLP